jgi:hypothetical protein
MRLTMMSYHHPRRPLRLADPVSRQIVQRYELALYLIDAAKDESDSVIEFFRAIERKFPDLSFTDFVAAAAIADAASRATIDEVKARQRPH